MRPIGGSRVFPLVLALCLANCPPGTISVGQESPKDGHDSEGPGPSVGGTQNNTSVGLSRSLDTPNPHATRTEAAQWSDEQLRAAIEKTKLGMESELLLLEVVRRGGQRWIDYLENRHDALIRFINQPPNDDDLLHRLSLSNLHLLTALRRVQRRPDPLRILVVGEFNRSYSLHERPQFRILIVNLDEEEQRGAMGFT